jgi:hypothetical protein
VTLAGDVFDPAGTLTGGAADKGAFVMQSSFSLSLFLSLSLSLSLYLSIS